jgi:putative ABC transport system permease protein
MVNFQRVQNTGTKIAVISQTTDRNTTPITASLQDLTTARLQDRKTARQYNMIKNYFKIALRNIKRYSTYSILNMSGMAIGMACSIMILLWVQDEWSFDRHFKDADNIYRVLEKFISIDGNLYQEATTPSPLAVSLKEQYPEILRTSRYVESPISVLNGDDYVYERIALADDDFLKMFNIKFVKGDLNSALSNPNNIVLTEEMANKYFGHEDPLGKILKTTGKPFTVTGVIKSLPLNSHLQFDLLGSYRLFGPENYQWDVHGGCFSYIEIKPGTDGQLVSDKIKNVVKNNVKGPGGYNPEIFLQNIKDIHLNSSGKYAYDVPGNGDITYVKILAIVAIFILIIACINFMNLATAQSSMRSKEIGMRKVTGSNKMKIILQFLGESLLIVFVAHIIGMILVEIFLPGFNNLTAKHLSVNYHNPEIYVSLISIVLICSLLAGAYPALYLSSLKPLNIIKGIISKNPGNAGFRRVMVILQFSLSVLLIICTLVVGSQLRYLQNKNLGLKLDQIVHIKFRPRVSGETLKADLIKNPDILSTTIAFPDFFDKDGTAQGFTWEGSKYTGDYYFGAIYTDIDFLKTFQLEMKDGRFFSNDFPGDTTALVVNEKAIEMLGFKDPVGRILTSGDTKYRIIGVIKNFHFKTLKSEIDPLAIVKLPPRSSGNCYIKMKGGNIPSTVSYIMNLLKSYNLNAPLDFKFLNDEYDVLYRTEQRIGKILLYSSLLAIIISCIGLIGLSMFMTELRTKEIGLRKVNGARSFEIFFLLSKEYLILVMISILIACPIAWYAMNKWLHSYAYRTSLNPWFFAEVGLMVLFIALLTVGLQSYKATRKNPVEALRYE